MKKRNPEATCGSKEYPCPYWEEQIKEVSLSGVRYGFCRNAPVSQQTHEAHWCGEHPDFFLEGDDENPS